MYEFRVAAWPQIVGLLSGWGCRSTQTWSQINSKQFQCDYHAFYAMDRRTDPSSLHYHISSGPSFLKIAWILGSCPATNCRVVRWLMLQIHPNKISHQYQTKAKWLIFFITSYAIDRRTDPSSLRYHISSRLPCCVNGSCPDTNCRAVKWLRLQIHSNLILHQLQTYAKWLTFFICNG